MEVSVQYHRTCMWVLVDTVAYVDVLQWRQSRMYACLSEESRICSRVVWQGFLVNSSSVQTDFNSHTTDVNRPYKYNWRKFVSLDLSRKFCWFCGFLEDYFCPQIWWLCDNWEGWFLPSKISKFENLKNRKLCLMRMDDLSMILLFPLL